MSTKITATAPAAPEISPGLPPKIADITPTTNAPNNATIGLICATKAKATTSGIIAKETVIPAKVSSLMLSFLFLMYFIIILLGYFKSLQR